MQILVVEDSAVYRKLIGDHLQRWDFDVTFATTGAEAWEVLQRPDSPKLVLLDWVLPDIDGIALCQRIRQLDSSRPYVYVILLTRRNGQANILSAMRAGADDYLVKPSDALELRAHLMVGKRILELQEKLIAARELMRIAATQDFLTGLMNRGTVLDALNRELERARRDRKPVSIILADIDHFKDVNDSLGHLFGDEALKDISHRLRAELRFYDSIGRYGGEEFLLILPGCNVRTTLVRGNQLCKCVANRPVVSSGVERVITLSMGIAVCEDAKDHDVEALLAQADLGLYAAKQKGRNRVEHVESLVSKQMTGSLEHL
jgi:two-component system cell cycle response regulator